MKVPSNARIRMAAVAGLSVFLTETVAFLQPDGPISNPLFTTSISLCSTTTRTTSTSSSLHMSSSMFEANTRTDDTNYYDQNVGLRQPSVAVPSDSSLARAGRSPPSSMGGSSTMQRQSQQQVQQQSQPQQPPQQQRRLKPIQVQGGSLKTWTFPSPKVESVQVFLKTEGRPMNANIEVWQGPDNTPMQVAVYVEDGALRPFSAVIGTPRNYPSSISIRNTATMEFPLEALLEPDREPIERYTQQALTPRIPSKIVQGGAVYTMPFAPAVQSVALLLRTDGRPLNARIELLQGPNNNKQVMEVYSEDGLERPFFTILETPGWGNVVRIVNTAVMEFPLTADVQPYMVDERYDEENYLREWEENNRAMGGSPNRRYPQSNPFFTLNLN